MNSSHYFGIKCLDEWDSRESTLYDYCHKLELRWSFDNEEWHEFRPTYKTAASLTVEYNRGSQYEQFLDRQDMSNIAKMVKDNVDIPLSSELVSEAHKFEDSEDFKQSYIMGISALERIFNELLECKLKSYLKILNQFTQASNSTNLLIISTLLNLPPEDITKALQAIDIRNKITHVGILGDEPHYDILHGLFRIVSLINQNLIGTKLKFPPLELRFRQSFRIM